MKARIREEGENLEKKSCKEPVIINSPIDQRKIIIIVGPTAAGKTAIAIKTARHFGTDIISADSRQCFKALTIGTAKPSDAELKIVRHYFINSHAITDEVNAGIFEQVALEYAGEIFRRHPVAVMCGGTGLYVRAFCEGIEEIPPVPPEIRDRISREYKIKGLSWLQETVRKQDPAFYATGETSNPHRLMRALEVMESAGKSIVSFRKGERRQRDFELLKIGLELPKELLHERINARTEKMIADGLVEEVKSLLPYRFHNALQTVGYQEIFAYLDGAVSLPEAIEKIKMNTRRYAKRQLTWFRKDKSIQWIDARDETGIMELAKAFAGFKT